MRVLVTGGAGFIGSHVADRYLAEGCEVTIVDDLSTGLKERVPEGARLVQMAIQDPALKEVFAEGAFDVVNHHAAQIDVRASVADPQRDTEINLLGLVNVLECARRHEAGRFIFISSGGVVYGEAETVPTPESAPFRPGSPYGVSKAAGELYLYYYGVVHGLEYAALRYSNVYGPRQSPHGEAGVIAIFGLSFLKGEPITIFGDGTQERDYVYVEDVVAANWLATTKPLPPPASVSSRSWNIGTRRGTSVNELADCLAEVIGVDVERISEPARAGELQTSVLDASRARDDLGWEPTVSLAEGLERTLSHLKSDDRGGE